MSPPVLALPTLDGEFVLDTDASAEAIWTEFSQIQDGQERPIAYRSLSLSAEQRRYCTTRKKLLAVARFTHMYQHYLLGRKFIVHTNPHSFMWLMSFRCPQDQLARWLEELSQYHMVIQHRPGRRHFNADALSRLPVLPGGCGTRLEVHPSDQPCGGCPKCKKANESWNAFAKEVDDVRLLSKQGYWSCDPDMEDFWNPELSEAVAVGEEPGVRSL